MEVEGDGKRRKRFNCNWSANGTEKVEARVVGRSVDSTCLASCTKSVTNMPRNLPRPLRNLIRCTVPAAVGVRRKEDNKKWNSISAGLYFPLADEGGKKGTRGKRFAVVCFNILERQRVADRRGTSWMLKRDSFTRDYLLRVDRSDNPADRG